MKQPRGAAGSDLILFIFFLIVLGIVWALTGGPDRSISREGPFLNPPFPLGDGSAYSVPGVNIPAVDENRGTRRGEQVRDDEQNTFTNIIARIRGTIGVSPNETSPYAGAIELSRGDTRSNDPANEYVTLKTSRDLEGRITISDWRIESAITLAGTVIGDATGLPFSGRVNTESPVSIGPDTTVYVITGRSPIGTSFRTNICTGYFEQFQDFSPRLDRECPLPTDELTTSIHADFIPNDECIDYVEDIDQCELILTSVPVQVGSACQNFIFEALTYNGCVEAHRNDANFYNTEWYIYLDRDQELWKSSREQIHLLDENGLVVDVLTY